MPVKVRLLASSGDAVYFREFAWPEPPRLGDYVCLTGFDGTQFVDNSPFWVVTTALYSPVHESTRCTSRPCRSP